MKTRSKNINHDSFDYLLKKRKKLPESKIIEDDIQEIEKKGHYLKKIKPNFTAGIEIEMFIPGYDLLVKEGKKNCQYGVIIAETGDHQKNSDFDKIGFAISPDGIGYSKKTNQVIEIATDPVNINLTNELISQTNKFISPFINTITNEINGRKNSKNTKINSINLSSIIDEYNKNQDDPEQELFIVGDNNPNYQVKLISKETTQKTKHEALGSIQFNFAIPPSFLNGAIKCFTDKLPKQPDGLEIQNNSHPEDTFIDDFGKKDIININRITLEKAKIFSDKISKRIDGNINDIENIKGFLTILYYYSTTAHLSSSKFIDQVIGITEHSPEFATKEYLKINPKIDLKQLFNSVKDHGSMSKKNLKPILESMSEDINESVTEIANTYNIKCTPFNNNTKIEFYYDNKSAKNVKFDELNQELQKYNQEWLSTSSKPIKPIKQDNGLIHTVFETRFTHLCELNNLSKEIESCYTEPLTKFYTKNQEILNSKSMDKKPKPNTITSLKQASKILPEKIQYLQF